MRIYHIHIIKIWVLILSYRLSASLIPVVNWTETHRALWCRSPVPKKQVTRPWRGFLIFHLLLLLIHLYDYFIRCKVLDQRYYSYWQKEGKALCYIVHNRFSNLIFQYPKIAPVLHLKDYRKRLELNAEAPHLWYYDYRSNSVDHDLTFRDVHRVLLGQRLNVKHCHSVEIAHQVKVQEEKNLNDDHVNETKHFLFLRLKAGDHQHHNQYCHHSIDGKQNALSQSIFLQRLQDHIGWVIFRIDLHLYLLERVKHFVEKYQEDRAADVIEHEGFHVSNVPRTDCLINGAPAHHAGVDPVQDQHHLEEDEDALETILHDLPVVSVYVGEHTGEDDDLEGVQPGEDLQIHQFEQDSFYIEVVIYFLFMSCIGHFINYYFI